MIKKTQSRVFRKVLFTVLLQLMAIKAFADPLDGPEPPPIDAPINDWLLPCLVFAILLGAFFYYKRSKAFLVK
jgi:hypothetical protein